MMTATTMRLRADSPRRTRSANAARGVGVTATVACSTRSPSPARTPVAGLSLPRLSRRLVDLGGRRVDDVVRALADLELAGVALDAVEAHVAHEPRVLDREVAGGLVGIEVEVLVPRPDRRREQHALRPVDALLGLALVVDDRVAVALDDVDIGLGRVAVADGVAA